MSEQYKKFLKTSIMHYKCSDSLSKDKEIIHETIEDGSETYEFMLRIEMARRTTRCDETIDMRGKVPFKCKEEKINKKIFWLDSASKEILSKSLEQNEGALTVGAFEDITLGIHTYKGKELKRQINKASKKKNQAVQKKKLNVNSRNRTAQEKEKINSIVEASSPAKEINYQPKAVAPLRIPLGYYHVRKSERMQYSNEIEIESGDDRFVVRGKDVSIDGVRIVSREEINLEVGKEVRLNYVELHDKVEIEFKGVPYQVESIEIEKKKQIIGLSLLHSEKSDKLSDYFTKRIQECLKTSRGRKKLDHEDSVQTAQSLVAEAIYSCTTNLITLIISRNNAQRLYLSDLCFSELNQNRISPFIQINNKYLFSYLTDSIFLQRLFDFAQGGSVDKDILFAVEAKDNSAYLRVYQPEDFISIDAWFYFINARLNNEGFRVYKVDAKPFSGLAQGRVKRSISRLLKKSPKEARKLKNAFDQITVLAYLHDVSYVYKRMNLASIPSDNDYSREVKFLKSEGIKAASQISVVPLSYIGNCHEERYLVELSTQIRIEGAFYECVTKDISVKGLCLRVRNELPLLTKGAHLEVGFPSLQKRVKTSVDLDRIPYELLSIVHGEDLLLTLTRVKDNSWEDYNEFFNDLIQRNITKIEIEYEDDITAVKSDLYSSSIYKSMDSIAVSIVENRTQGSESLRINETFEAGLLSSFFSLNKNQIDYSPFAVKSRLSAMLGKLLTEKMVELNFYIYKKLNKKSQQYEYYSATDIDFTASTQLITFLDEAVKYEYKIVKLSLSPSVKVDEIVINNALDFLHECSPHHSNKIRLDINKVIATGELIDVTSIFDRYHALVREK